MGLSSACKQIIHFGGVTHTHTIQYKILWNIHIAHVLYKFFFCVFSVSLFCPLLSERDSESHFLSPSHDHFAFFFILLYMAYRNTIDESCSYSLLFLRFFLFSLLNFVYMFTVTMVLLHISIPDGISTISCIFAINLSTK